MTHILVAYDDGTDPTYQRWEEVMAAMRAGMTEYTLRTLLPRWRENGDIFPDIQTGERVYVVYNRVTRGWFSLLAPPRRSSSGNAAYLDVNATRFTACGLEWVWGPHFGRSWRYVRFTEPCHIEFPDWATHPGLRVASPYRDRDAVAR